MPEDETEARLRRVLAERARQAPPPGPVEQRTLAAVRRGTARSHRTTWLKPASLRPVAVAASVLVVVGATAGGVALVRDLTHGTHTGASPVPSSSGSDVAQRPSASTATSATVATPAPSTGTASATSTPATVPAGPPTGRVPKGFTVADLTFVSTGTGWALGTTPSCAAKPCTSLVRTTDGGRSWVGIAPPVVGLQNVDDCTKSACVSGVRFADSHVGYLFGPKVLYLTTDGGAHWRRQSGGAEALEVGDGNVLRLTTTVPGCAPGCTYVAQMADIGTDTWRTVLKATTASAVSGTLVRAGAKAYVQIYGHTAGGASSAHTALYSSTDGGRTWSARGEPCPQPAGAKVEYDATSIAPAPLGSVVVLCEQRSRNRPAFLATSGNGARFVAGPATANLAAPVGAISSSVLLAQGATGTPRAGRLLRSTDGGRTWGVVATAAAGKGDNAGPGFLGFENQSVGRWVSPTEPATVWSTTDGGKHWSRHTFE
jgi:photosystem II stability/assembly factor-like uncharacterized protein